MDPIARYLAAPRKEIGQHASDKVKQALFSLSGSSQLHFKAMTGYCIFHHLLLALAKAVPDIIPEATLETH